MATHILLCRNKFKTAPSAERVMLTLFRDVNGPVLKHYPEKGETVNSVRYRTMLEENLKTAIHSPRRGFLSEGALLPHDSVRPHTAAGTVTAIQRSLRPSVTCLARLRKPCEDEV
jgi:hypothetical protein